MGKTIVGFEAAKFAVDQESRTLTGILLPFGEVSQPASDGRRYSFTKDTTTVPDVATVPHILNYGHDQESLNHQLGSAIKLSAEDDGVHVTYRVAKTPEGDRVLALADPEVKVLRSFSAEVEGIFEQDDEGIMRPSQSVVTGGAVVPKPAFIGAGITSVAASAARQEGIIMKCDKCGVVHAAGITECDPAAVATFQAQSAAFTQADGNALKTQVVELGKKVDGLADLKTSVDGLAQFQVKEEPIYRFAGSEGAPSGFDFATDMLAAATKGDFAALARIQKFTADYYDARFANQPTTTGDTSAVNPSQYRPDMFLGQAPVPASPLFDFFRKGGLADVTPFFWSKLDRTNTDVGITDHTEDVDPETRDIVTAAGATVTPVPVSGQVHITREVGDQGGNPQISGLVMSEFDRSYSIALEAKTAALVLASTMAELGGAITAGETDGAVAGQIVESGLIGLQFLADGFRFQKAFGHIDLYKLLAAATKGTDNADKLYPIINPQNATGQAASKWASLDIGGYSMAPAASLGATDTNKKSVVADPNAVHVWNSALQRLDKLQETVAGWNIGVFGYFAGIVYDVTGLRKITYDPTA